MTYESAIVHVIWKKDDVCSFLIKFINCKHQNKDIHFDYFKIFKKIAEKKIKKSRKSSIMIVVNIFIEWQANRIKHFMKHFRN
jgi:hypothetical protein